MTEEELDHELGHLASDEKWGWIAEPIDAELTRLRAIADAADDVWCDQSAGINDGAAMERLRIALGREVCPV